MKNLTPQQIVLQFQPEYSPFHEDLSAVLLTPDRYLWLASDETTSLERLSFNEDRTFREHQHFPLSNFLELPSPSDEEIDIEGLTYDNYYLWLVGSHSWKRKKPKPDKKHSKNIERLATTESQLNRYILARIPLINGELFSSCPHPTQPNQQLTAAKLELTKKGNILMDALETDPHLQPFIVARIPSKDNGFDVEGLAIANGKLFLGLRGPVLRGWAFILEIEVEATCPTKLKLKKVGKEKPYKKHSINLQGLGVRDLCFEGKDLLILAGPTMDLDGPVKVFRLKNALDSSQDTLHWKPEEVLDIPYGNRNHHAEGMTMFDPISQNPSVLIVYDSPMESTTLDESTGVLADVFPLS